MTQGYGPQIDLYIKPLSEDAAFNKGVDYFVELIFFYGVLIYIGLWEIKKGQEAAERMKNQLAGMETKKGCDHKHGKSIKKIEKQEA